MTEESSLHKQVLNRLNRLDIPGYELLIERRKGRLDLPNPRFQSGQKEPEQKKRTLCYTDAILHTQGKPRLLLELVHNNPTRPNGITGLTVNIDRIAAIHQNIDLLYVVLADEMTAFFCRQHGRGHYFGPKYDACLQRCLEAGPELEGYSELIHEGVAANFKKVLVDYPITDYLRNMPAPSVLLLNAHRAETDWDTYEPHALRRIRDEIDHIISSPQRRQTRLAGVSEIMPNYPEQLTQVGN